MSFQVQERRIAKILRRYFPGMTRNSEMSTNAIHRFVTDGKHSKCRKARMALNRSDKSRIPSLFPRP